MKAVNAYYRKHKTLDGCPNLSAESIEKMKSEKKPSIRAQLAQDKEALKAAPKKAAEKTKKQYLERS